jgi:predicted deacylase
MSVQVITIKTLDGIESMVPAGEDQPFSLLGSESFSGMPIRIPLFVERGVEPGPTVFLSAALHGNEINGTGAIRNLIADKAFTLKSGMLIMVPVVNVLGFERHSRYLPDRRDLNRCFPGSNSGSMSSRMARRVFDEVVRRCDYGIDLHTAAMRRTNFPNVRGDLSNPGVRRLAEMFGCHWIIAGKGPRGSLRREATRNGVPTIILEAGEVCKVEPSVAAVAIRGVKNVLADLGMIEGEPIVPPLQVVIEKTTWTRADRGGFLQFHTSPGEIVLKDQPIATNTSLLGAERNVVVAPFDSVVIGMTTLPAVSPGEPVCHLGRVDPDTLARLKEIRSMKQDPVDKRLRKDLATNIHVVQRPETD